MKLDQSVYPDCDSPPDTLETAEDRPNYRIYDLKEGRSDPCEDWI